MLLYLVNGERLVIKLSFDTEQTGRRSCRIKKKSTRLEGYDTRGPDGVEHLFSFTEI